MISETQNLECDGPVGTCPRHGRIAKSIRGSIPMMRSWMKENGWRRIAGMDLCPRCLAHHKRRVRSARKVD